MPIQSRNRRQQRRRSIKMRGGEEKDIMDKLVEIEGKIDGLNTLIMQGHPTETVPKKVSPVEEVPEDNDEEKGEMNNAATTDGATTTNSAATTDDDADADGDADDATKSTDGDATESTNGDATKSTNGDATKSTDGDANADGAKTGGRRNSRRRRQRNNRKSQRRQRRR